MLKNDTILNMNTWNPNYDLLQCDRLLIYAKSKSSQYVFE